ncbi:MAG: hypothetical protein WC291_06990 [Thermodesulfovibrionales bacterium]|jgi:hypothetical protein
MFIFLIAVLFVGLLFLIEHRIGRSGSIGASYDTRAAAGDRFELSALPGSVFLHDNGQLRLIPEQGQCIEIAIVSNSAFTVTFRTRNPGGNIRSRAGLELYTCYSILPSRSQEAEPWSPAWRQGGMLKDITESSDNRYEYKRALCVVAHKDFLPGSQQALEEALQQEGQARYEDTVIVTAMNSKGSSASLQVQVVFQLP